MKPTTPIRQVAAALLLVLALAATAAVAEQPRLIDRPATRPAARVTFIQSIHRVGYSDGTVVDRVAGTTFLSPQDTCAKP